MWCGYEAQSRVYEIETPVRRHNVKRLVHKSYPSLIGSLVGNPAYRRLVVLELARTIKREIRAYTSAKHKVKNPKAVASWSWQELLRDLTQHAPMMMSILSGIVRKPSESTRLLCTLASMLMKRWSNTNSLLQQAVSVLLYGNGATKSVSIMYYCTIIHYMYHRFLILYIYIYIRYMLTLKMLGSLLNTPIYRSLQLLMLCMSYSGMHPPANRQSQ